MVGYADAATNLYHTSYTTVPAHPASVPVVKVAYAMLPAVVVQLLDEVSVTALAQRSLAGGSVTQILKSPLAIGAEVAPLELYSYIISGSNCQTRSLYGRSAATDARQ